MAWEKESEFSRSAHACGFVSTMTVRSEGAGSSQRQSSSSKQNVIKATRTLCTRLIVLCCIYGIHGCSGKGHSEGTSRRPHAFNS